MKEPRHHIDDLFNKGIEGHTEYPSSDLWNKIEADLDKNIATVYKRKYRVVKRNAAIVLLLLIALVLYQSVNLYTRKVPGNMEKEIIYVTTPKQLPRTSLPSNNTVGQPQMRENISVNQDGLVATIDQQIVSMETVTGTMQTGLNNPRRNNRPRLKIGDQAEDGNSLLTQTEYQGLTMEKSIVRSEKNLLLTVATEKPDVSQDVLRNEIQKRLRTALSKENSAAPVAEPVLAKKSKSFEPRFSVTVSGAPVFTLVSLRDDPNHWSRSGPVAPGGSNGGGSSGGGNGGNNGGNNGGGTGGGNSIIGNPPRSDRGYSRNELLEDESQNVGFMAGVKLNFSLSNKLSFQTGMNYLSTSSSVAPRVLYARKDRDGNIGYRMNCGTGYSFLNVDGTTPRVGDSLLVTGTRNSIAYLGVPFMVEYKLVEAGRFTLAASAGAQANFLLAGKTSSVAGKGTPSERYVSNKTEGIKSTYFTAVASVSAEWRLQPNLSLSLSPTGQLGLGYMNEGTGVKTKPSYLGLSAGVKFNF